LVPTEKWFYEPTLDEQREYASLVEANKGSLNLREQHDSSWRDRTYMQVWVGLHGRDEEQDSRWTPLTPYSPTKIVRYVGQIGNVQRTVRASWEDIALPTGNNPLEWSSEGGTADARAVASVWGEIRDADIGTAVPYLRRRGAELAGVVQIGGVAFPREVVGFGGPLVIIVWQLFLWMHLQESAKAGWTVSRGDGRGWIYLYRTRLASALAYTSLLILPVAVTAVGGIQIIKLRVLGFSTSEALRQEALPILGVIGIAFIVSSIGVVLVRQRHRLLASPAS
jgi:hypothetical protein